MKPRKVAVTQSLKQVSPNKITDDGIKNLNTYLYRDRYAFKVTILYMEKRESCSSMMLLKHTGNKALQTITVDI